MTIRNLESLLAPKSVALIGASQRESSVGAQIAHNLAAGGFVGEVYFVNPKHPEILGRACYASVAALPAAPQLAIIATPPASLPSLIAELGARGTRAAVVITAGLGSGPHSIKQAMLDAARPYYLRILGPNSIGMLLPREGLNASFAHRDAPKGDLAFLSQSGALLTAVIDWAATRNIGFSHVLSLGDMADVDFGDMLDYLAGDTQSRAILLYMEALTNAPKFISAARRAARVKPVIVVKSGRHAEGARAAQSHTGALAGADAAYDAAFRRTGLVRVKTLPDLFAAAEMLARRPRINGERLMIVTNGGGAGVLATDELLDAGGKLAGLSPSLKQALDNVLPATWSAANPIDIIGDAGPDRYGAALSRVLADPEADAVLVIQCPTALASSRDNASAVCAATNAANATGKPVLTCWLGDESAKPARQLFDAARIASFETPSDAVTGFMQLVRHARAQSELMQTPDGAHPRHDGHTAETRRLVAHAISQGHSMLTSVAAKAILKTAGIPVADSFVAATPADVRRIAAEVLATSKACVVKILSPDISHKSDVGGVRLSLESAEAAGLAAGEMLKRVAVVRPDAIIEGFMVEPMIRRPDANELIIGMSVDETFGPLILFGAGGTAVEVMADRALALPPLDHVLARHMIGETRIARLLSGYRDRPAANLDEIAGCLVKVSNLIVHNPEIRELDINPLLADDKGILAIDARIRLACENEPARQALAIRPYPAEWESSVTIDGIGDIAIRPVRPIDELLYKKFFAHVSRDDVRMRFFTPRVALSHEYLARLTQIDYAREMALVAIARNTGELLGVVRLILEPDLWRGEYGILVRSDLKGKGLGRHLMQRIIAYARATGVKEITGLVLGDNAPMLDMAQKLGFDLSTAEGEPGAVKVTLNVASLHPR